MSRRGSRKGAPDGTDAGPPPPFWKRLSVQVGLVAGTLLALASLLNAVPQVVKAGHDAVRAVVGLFPRPVPPPSTPVVEMKALDILPESLLNVIGTNDFLHWLSLSVQNASRERLEVVVEVEVLGGPAREESRTAAEFTVDPEARVSGKPVDPLIKFMLSDLTRETRLKLVWRVTTRTQEPLGTGTEDITILPKNTIDWDLRAPGGKAVPTPFLVASLAAWAQTPHPEIEKASREALFEAGTRADPAARFQAWLARCYARLFEGSDRVTVDAPALRFPLGGRQVIRGPVEVVRLRRATPLEASILLAAYRWALGPDVRGRIVLFALPATSGGTRAKTLLLAWSGGAGWQALDLHQAGRPFEANEAEATPRLRQVLTAHPEIMSAVDARGVFLAPDAGIVALDFWRATRHYGIRPLP